MCAQRKYLVITLLGVVCFFYLSIYFSSRTGIAPKQVEFEGNSFDIRPQLKNMMQSMLSYKTDLEEVMSKQSPVLEKVRQIVNCVDKTLIPKIQQRGDYWVLYNYIIADSSYRCYESITYTTHGDHSFLDNAVPLLERWNGPVSVAIYAPGSDFKNALDTIAFYRECSSPLIKKFVTFHIYFPTGHIPREIPQQENLFVKRYNCSKGSPLQNFSSQSMYRFQKELLYPVNVGRNIARETAQTHFVLPSDIELYPSLGLIDKFLTMISENSGYLLSKNPKVFPISIFEVKADQQVPENKTVLQNMLKKGDAIPFHKVVCSNCHSIPKASEWLAAKETHDLHIFTVAKRVGKFHQWEPIYIGTQFDPYYDERLSWEGKSDKMTQGYILCVLDYDFMILDNAFLVHKPGIKLYKNDPKRNVLSGKSSYLIKTVIYSELKVLYGEREGCTI